MKKKEFFKKRIERDFKINRKVNHILKINRIFYINF
jgi:hypothetical protein